jgi:hypothetical protein
LFTFWYTFGMKETIPSSFESEQVVTQSELEQGLSVVWWKTVQEVIPGKLRNVTKEELSENELNLYRVAYKMLGDMTKEGKAEVTFRPEDGAPENGDTIHNQSNRPEFRLVNIGGKTERSDTQRAGKLVSHTSSI